MRSRCHFGGQKRKISSGAPKWAIQVKILLNDLFKLIKGTFHLLGLVLSDLKGGRGSTFCVVDFALITAFCPLTRRSSRGRNSIKTTAAVLTARLLHLYQAWFPCAVLPEGPEITNYIPEKWPCLIFLKNAKNPTKD